MSKETCIIGPTVDVAYAILENELERRKTQYLWQTKDGRRIPIEQMTDDHIKNCLKYMDKEDEVRDTLGLTPWDFCD